MNIADGMRARVDGLLKSGALTGKAVYLFGHCRASEELAGYLLENGVRVAAMLDNNKAKHGMACGPVTVTPPEVLDAADASQCVVLIAARAHASMAAQLKRMGFGGRVFEVAQADTFSEFSLAEDVWRSRLQRARRGADTLARIRSTLPAAHLVICPYNAMGDVYQALSFLPAYCQKRRLSETAVLVTGRACAQTAELFEIKNIVELDETQMDELVQAAVFLREDNCLIAHHDRPYTNDMIRYLSVGFLSFADFYRIGVYGLDRHTAPCVPTGGLPYAGTQRLKKGRTLILSPYAKSVVKLPDAFWTQLAEEYRRDGFDVYTNVAGDERPVEGTEPFSAPVREMAAAVEYAGRFIGLRSGLCDVLSAARCKKTVVFPDCCYSAYPVKAADFFAMPDWEQLVYSPDGAAR